MKNVMEASAIAIALAYPIANIVKNVLLVLKLVIILDGEVEVAVRWRFPSLQTILVGMASCPEVSG